MELDALAPDHMLALRWFRDHRGQSVAWAEIKEFSETAGNPRLATQAKGIYKPEGSEYALSVKQTIDSPYADKEVEHRGDGTWVYPYFQENPDPTKRDDEYTNRGLVRCLEDGVPVGVLLQAKPKPGVEYQVLGLARVSDWRGGYFILEGYSPDGSVRSQEESHTDAARERALSSALRPNPESFDPASIDDLRKRSIAEVVRRRGQTRFRNALIKAYDGRCAISGCDATEALEAAHISPYRGDDSDHPQNGLLLRADLHSLFDLGLIAIETMGMKVILAPRLGGSSYKSIAGSTIRLPENLAARPSLEALDAHRDWSGI